MDVSEIEAAKQGLVDALTMLERLGIVDFNGHASVRLADGRILINSGASVRSKLTTGEISIIDGDGRLLDGRPPPMEFHIHSEIYRRRADAGAVVHGHPKWSTLLTSAGVEVRPVLAQGCLVAGLPLFDDPLSINTAPRGAAVAETLGGACGALLRAHGSVLVGADILEAFVLATYLELNCERQVEAARLGTPYVFSDTEIAASEESLRRRNLFRKCWDHYHAKLA